MAKWLGSVQTAMHVTLLPLEQARRRGLVCADIKVLGASVFPCRPFNRIGPRTNPLHRESRCLARTGSTSRADHVRATGIERVGEYGLRDQACPVCEHSLHSRKHSLNQSPSPPHSLPIPPHPLLHTYPPAPAPQSPAIQPFPTVSSPPPRRHFPPPRLPSSSRPRIAIWRLPFTPQSSATRPVLIASRSLLTYPPPPPLLRPLYHHRLLPPLCSTFTHLRHLK